MESTTASTPAVSGPRTLRLVFLTLFLDLVGFSIIFPLFPSILDFYLPQGEGTNSLLGRCIAPLATWAENSGAANPRFVTAVLFGGLLGSLYSILQFISAPLWGAYSDRVGRRRVLLLTIAGLAVSYAVWTFAASFWLFVLARVLGGIMGGNLSVATAAVADITTREKRSAGMAIIGIAFGLGFIVGPAIGGFCASIDLTVLYPQLTAFGINPFSTPALVSLLLALVNLIWVARAFKETLPPEKRKKGPITKPAFNCFRSNNPAIRRTNGIYLLYMLAFSGMEFTLTFLAVERFAFTPMQNGGLFVFVGFIMILIQGGVVRRLSGKICEQKMARFGLAAGVVAFIALAFAPATTLFFIALAIMATSIALISPTLSALVSRYASDQDQGQTLGSFRSAGSLARAIGPILAAAIYFKFGSQVAYCFGGGLIVIPLLLAFALPKPDTA